MTDDNPYFGGDGKPRLRDSIVLFLDLLGTRGVRGSAEAERHLHETFEAIEQLRQWMLVSDDEAYLATQWFSDNLGLSYLVDEPDDATTALDVVVTQTALLQGALLQRGFFARGAITRGDYFRGAAFIYGPALDRTVELEKTRALYPRIVLDEASVAVARHGLGATDDDESFWRQRLLVDEAGVVFVDYLSGILEDLPDSTAAALLAQHQWVIETRLFEYDGLPRVHDKYRWLATYHDDFLARREADVVERGIDPAALPVRGSRPLGSFRAFGDGLEPPPPGG